MPDSQIGIRGILSFQERNHEVDSRSQSNTQLDPGMCEKARREIMDRAGRLKLLPFREAAEHWLTERELYLQSTTILCYRDYIKRLNTFFGDMTLGAVHIGHLLGYQRQMKALYHPASVNHDLNTLSQIMKHADLWGPLAPHYSQLPIPRWHPPKVLSEQEEGSFFELAASSNEWWLAYAVATLTLNTTACGKELRTMRRRDVDLDSGPPRIFVRDGKNIHRPRPIPLNEYAQEAMKTILKRTREQGSCHPDHFVFPRCLNRATWDATQPAGESWIRYQWKKLVDEAQRRGLISFRVKPHNLRHQAITRLLENGAPEETVRAIAGHVTQQIMRHYSHGRIETMARVVGKMKPAADGKRKAVENVG
jgi:integrase